MSEVGTVLTPGITPRKKRPKGAFCVNSSVPLIKGIAIIFVIVAVLALGVLKILDGNVIATILSGVIGYTLGTTFKRGKELD